MPSRRLRKILGVGSMGNMRSFLKFVVAAFCGAGIVGNMWSFLKFVVAAFCGAGILWFGVSYQAVQLPAAISPAPLATLDITYADFVTIMLTCVTVVLAAVGIGVGVVAAYTITNLKAEAKAEVRTAVDERMKGVEKTVAALAYGVGRNLDDDADVDEEVR